MDNKLNLKLALKDPKNCSVDEMDDILDAQLQAVRHFRSMGITRETSQKVEKVESEKKRSGKRKALKRIKLKV